MIAPLRAIIDNRNRDIMRLKVEIGLFTRDSTSTGRESCQFAALGGLTPFRLGGFQYPVHHSQG
jgi:hypothetical protein